MRHHKTYMYINFQQNRVNRSVLTACTQLYSPKKYKLHKFATTNSNFKKNDSKACIIVKRTCISIFSKIGLVDQSKPCTQIYLQKIASYINLQLLTVILKKSII